MIHALDPVASFLISAGYLGFVFMFLMNVSKTGRASRAGRSMNFLIMVFVVCAFCSYAIQFAPHSWHWSRELLGWFLAMISLALFASGCGVRLARSMDYENTLKLLDAANARIADLEATSKA